MPYEGDERRKYSSDHDLLIRIETILSANGRKLDDFIFETKTRLDGHDRDLKFTNQIIYGAIGAFTLLQFFLQIYQRTGR